MPTACSSPPRRALLAFEGGGAKGLVHLGALHAVEATGRFEIAAVAGTSAGAMIAALVAAGYRAEDLFSLAGPDAAEAGHKPPAHGFASLLDGLGLADATAVFGAAPWARLAGFRRLLDWGARGALAALAGHLLMILVLQALYGGWGALAGLVLLFVHAGWLGWRLVLGGASLDGVRDCFDRALSAKCPAAAAQGRRVLFRDLPHLRICAANLTRRRLEVFSAQTAPDVAVADAVAASVCFPFAFRPWVIDRGAGRGEELHLDGGLISNLPAWCLDEERRLDPDAITLAIAIRDTDAASPATRRHWLPAMFKTTIFGGEVLSTRGDGPIEILRLDTTVPLLAFDITRAAAIREVRAQRQATLALLETRVLGFPDKQREDVRGVRMAALSRIEDFCAGRGLAFAPGDIRAALAIPEDHLAGGFLLREAAASVRSLTLRYGDGFDGWADEGLVLPVEGTTVGEAWRPLDPASGAREPAFRFLDEPDLAFRGSANRLRGLRMRPGLAWVLGVPVALMVPDPGTGAGSTILDAVLVLDGTTRLAPDRALRGAFIEMLNRLIAEEIRPSFALPEEV